MCVEWVAGSPWNQWPDGRGIRSNTSEAHQSSRTATLPTHERLADQSARALVFFRNQESGGFFKWISPFKASNSRSSVLLADYRSGTLGLTEAVEPLQLNIVTLRDFTDRLLQVIWPRAHSARREDR